MHPERKAPAPEASQKVAGGKRRTATAGGEVRRAATGRKGEESFRPGGAEEGNGKKVHNADPTPTEDVDRKAISPLARRPPVIL
jgi:hypothetical protein